MALWERHILVEGFLIVQDSVFFCADYCISVKIQEDAPLVMVRLRVVKLLGHLGGKINRNLVAGNQPIYNFLCCFILQH